MTPIITFILFAIAATGSPGPNNLLLMHSGLNFGIRKTWPYFIGSYIGSLFIYCLISFGFSYLFLKYPAIKSVIKVLGSVYMLYLALKIAQMNETKVVGETDKPFTILQGVCMQLVNPKLWIVALAMNSIFQQNTNVIINSLYFILLLSLITIFRMFLWIILGKFLQKVIKSPVQRSILNLTLGFFLAVTVLFLWI